MKKTVWVWALALSACVDGGPPEATRPGPGRAPVSAPVSRAETPSPTAFDFEQAPFTDGEAQFRRVRELLEERYYRELDDDALWGAAIQGMLEHADPSMSRWNTLLTPTQMQALEQDLKGALVGVGVWIEVDDDTGLAHVRLPLPGSPSEKGGVEADDVVVKVDGRSCRGWSLSELVSRIRGEEGTKVSLTLLREGDLVEVTLVRAPVDMPSVESMMLPSGVGMLSVSSFNEKTVPAVERSLSSLRDAGATSVVVDLRHNHGGSLKHAVATADRLLPVESVILTQNAGRPTEKRYVAEQEAVLGEAPVAVLIDAETSSGAEFVAVALREAGATLIGDATRGKWSAQWLEKLDNGYGVKLTAALITGADGKRYPEGVIPELSVQGPERLFRGTDVPAADRLAQDAVLRTAHGLLQTR